MAAGDVAPPGAGSSAGPALAIGGMAAATLPLAGAGFGTVWLGFDGLWLGLGLTGAMLLAGLLIAAPMQRSGSASVEEFLRLRFGSAVAVAAVVLVLVPGLTAFIASQLHSLSSLVRFGLGAGSDPLFALGGALALLLATSIAMLRFGAIAVAATFGLLGVLCIVGLAGLLSWHATGNPWAPFAYGALLPEMNRLEVALLGQKLADFNTLKAHATPYSGIDPLNFWGAVLCVTAAAAALPHLAAPVMGRGRAGGSDTARSALAWAMVMLLPVVLLLPALAVFAKFGLYQMLAKGVPIASLPPWLNDLASTGLVTICGAASDGQPLIACKAGGSKGLLRLQDLNFDGAALWLGAPRVVQAAPALQSAGVLLAGAAALLTSAAAGAGGLIALARALVFFGTPTTSRGGAAEAALPTLGAVGVAAIVALGILLWPRDAAAMAMWALPIIAGGLLPVLLLASCWRRTTSAGALAGIIIGGGVTFYYLVAARYFPVSFNDLWQGLAANTPGAERKYVILRDAWNEAAPGDKAAAWQALVAHARGMTNWWGLRPLAIALVAVPAGLLATMLVSLLSGKPTPEQRAGFDHLHQP